MTRKEYKNRMAMMTLAIVKAPTPVIPGVGAPVKKVKPGKMIRKIADNIERRKYDGDMSYDDMWVLMADVRRRHGMD